MSDGVAVLFSGGSDSTLAAVLAAERFKRVCLVTYSHPFMFFHKKVEVNIPKLEEAFPDVEFTRHKESITVVFQLKWHKVEGR